MQSALEPIIYMFIPFIVLLIFGSGYFYRQWEEMKEEKMGFKYPKITREQALAELKNLLGDPAKLELIHINADLVLLDLIGDDEIREAFKQLPKGHSLSEVG